MKLFKKHGKEFSIFLFKLKLFIILKVKNMLLGKEEDISQAVKLPTMAQVANMEDSMPPVQVNMSVVANMLVAVNMQLEDNTQLAANMEVNMLLEAIMLVEAIILLLLNNTQLVSMLLGNMWEEEAKFIKLLEARCTAEDRPLFLELMEQDQTMKELPEED